jgi:hypothetical protein
MGSLGIIARPATAGTDPSIGDMVFPNPCDHVVYILVLRT